MFTGQIMFDPRSLGAVPGTAWEAHKKVGLISNVTETKQPSLSLTDFTLPVVMSLLCEVCCARLGSSTATLTFRKVITACAQLLSKCEGIHGNKCLFWYQTIARDAGFSKLYSQKSYPLTKWASIIVSKICHVKILTATKWGASILKVV